MNACGLSISFIHNTMSSFLVADMLNKQSCFCRIALEREFCWLGGWLGCLSFTQL